MFQRPVKNRLTLIQACDWASYGILPDENGQEIRSLKKDRLSKEQQKQELYRASRMFFEGFKDKVFKLYKLNDYGDPVESFTFDEIEGYNGKKTETIYDLIKEAKPAGDEEYYSLLSYIMKTWTHHELYFDTNEIRYNIEPENYETYKTNKKYKLELNNNKIFIYTPDINNQKIFLKRLNDGITRDFIEFLFKHPNEPFYKREITEAIHTQDLVRAENIVSTLKREIKAVLDTERLPEQIKEEAKYAVDKSFYYKNSVFKFIPEI